MTKTLDGLAAGWFFLRYWEGGPHLRLRVLPASGHAGDAIRALIADRLDRYLRERPSAGLMKHADYLRLAPIFAARERLSSYAERLYPNNSVVFLPYRREHHRNGHGSSIEARLSNGISWSPAASRSRCWLPGARRTSAT